MPEEPRQRGDEGRHIGPCRRIEHLLHTGRLFTRRNEAELYCHVRVGLMSIEVIVSNVSSASPRSR